MLPAVQRGENHDLPPWHRLVKTTATAWLLLAVCTPLAAAGIEPGDGFIDVTGGPVWYRAVGDGPGVPLLLLHGGPGSTSCGFSVLEPLGGQRPMIRYDQLGTGRSGRPDDLSLWTVERFVEELHTVRQRLGLEQLHLLGHSWGATLAAAYVLEKGTEGIVSLTLSSPLLSTPQWITDADLLRGQLPEDVQATLKEHEEAGTLDSDAYQDASKIFYERHVYGDPKPVDPEACAGAPWNQVIYEYMWGSTEFNATGTLLDFDVTGRLHEIDAPVLFITGELDEARPETVAGFQQQVPGARMVVMKDVAHYSFGKDPEGYMAILEEFLDVAEAKSEPAP
ncbi:MAG: alpha/beta fold hydrolase [Lysobacterales bacterium]|nr:MAG: alpha/beta fold hydrolase [Xanthomonadales bacterium]